ncbi:MAG: histidine kinase [Flavobacteriaceae bacterium]
MNRVLKAILLTGLLFNTVVGYGQYNGWSRTSPTFEVRVSVIEKGTNIFIKTAEVSVHGKKFPYDSRGYYYVNARIGDELVVSNPSFEVVYHRIKSREDIRIFVDGFTNSNESISKIRTKRKNLISDIKVHIINKETKKPIKTAYASVNGKAYEYNHIKGYYPVRGKLGDKLLISYDGRETTSYTIESYTIDLQVTIVSEKTLSIFSQHSYRPSSVKRKLNTSAISYRMNLDSAHFYKKKDIEKSLSFIENILKENYSKRRNGATYRLLGDIYYEWKQYDLALSSYKNSLQYVNNERTKLQASKAAIQSKNFDEALSLLVDISTDKLGLFEKILTYESLGDIYLEKKEFSKADINYKKALKISEENKVPSKVTDLNSKLGDISAAQGKISVANLRFNNSISLANKENSIRSIEEKEKVADFYNSTQQFDKEIELRKQTLLQTKQVNDSILTIQDDEVDDKTSTGTVSSNLDEKDLGKYESLYNTINSQSINYKIGRALIQKEDYKEAIPFLKKSIEDADKEKDLVVKKDATRKLSEVYDNVGEYDKALKAYRDYVALVDTLYIRKGQEIARAKRFEKKISDSEHIIEGLVKNRDLYDSKISLAIKDQQIVEEQNKNQRFVIYSLGIGILALVVFTYLLFKSNRQQKTANNLLALKSMRSQMNPHFIFNALNSVNSFIAVNDERNANRYLSEFSVLMRSVLENSDEDFIPFTKEIELLELYVKLEHNRFKDKFDYNISVDKSIRLEEFSIPPMLLQPYIENAIWHGLRYKEEKGNLEISINKINDESISIVIQDDGVGRKKSKELKTKNQLKRKSKGMNTIQNRIAILNNMYQGRVEVEVSDAFNDGTGTKVKLILKKA